MKISKVTRENNHWSLFSKDEQVAKAKQLVIAEGRVPNIVTQVGLKGNDKLRLLPGLQYKFKTSDVDFPDTDYFDFYIDPMRGVSISKSPPNFLQTSEIVAKILLSGL